MMETKIKRQEALDMVTAAMAVVIQTQNLVLSAEIINDAGDKYGRPFVEGLLLELTGLEFAFDLKSIANDVLIKRASLSLMKAVPLTWMSTRN